MTIEAFQKMRVVYGGKVIAAAINTALAAAAARMLYDGGTNSAHATTFFLLFLVTGGLALLYGIDATTRWRQLRQIGIVESASRPYGTTPATSRGAAADDLGRKTGM